jgi:pyridoxamine 5'-phosphate oxidase
MKSVYELREEYSRARLDEQQAHPDPFQQFQLWFDQAVAAETREPNAMAVATVGQDGRPSVRMMLLKGFEDGRFVFYTNRESRKGLELASRPHAALVFFWSELERQVRIEGEVAPVSEDAADAYFRIRPRGSQLGAWASAQSAVLPSREVLERKLAEAERRFDGRDVERPPYWGGFALTPRRIEFWQGRPDRLHDRLAYTRDSKGVWKRERLSP